MRGFVAVAVIELRFGDVNSLKDKRKRLAAIKAYLHRTGCAVSEIEEQDRWRNAVLMTAVTGQTQKQVQTTVNKVSDWLDEQYGYESTLHHWIASLEDLSG